LWDKIRDKIEFLGVEKKLVGWEKKLSLNQLGVDPLKEWVSSRFVTTLMSTILKNNFLWLTRILILNYYNLN
jgi:hypothetical protein